MKEVKQTDGFEVHAFSDVHLHLDVVCRCVSVFPISLLFSISTICWIHAAIYFVHIYIYMYKRAGTSDILTFVYTTGLVVFWIDLCRNCVRSKRN